jgi:hypothetical protein
MVGHGWIKNEEAVLQVTRFMIPLVDKEHGTHTKTAISQEKQLKKCPSLSAVFATHLPAKTLRK